MIVTVDKVRTESMGLEVTNVSVVYDTTRSILMIHGMLLPKPSYCFDGTNFEPQILCSFYDGQKRVLYATPVHEYIPFNINKYGVFSLEVPSDKIAIDSIAEIRLLPYFSRCETNDSQL